MLLRVEFRRLGGSPGSKIPVALKISGPFRVLFIRVPYYLIGDLRREPKSIEYYPCRVLGIVFRPVGLGSRPPRPRVYGKGFRVSSIGVWV